MKCVYSIGLVVLAVLFAAGCETAPQSAPERAALQDDVQATMTRMRAHDPGLNDLMRASYGYVLFPSVGKGGLVVGGAYGRGEVFEKGQRVGYANLQQASVGLQAGGQEYSELIVFENEFALRRFQAGNYSFGADASAVALKAGAAAAARFKDGVAVFTMPKGGLMFEAAIAGQKFNYEPISQTNSPTNTQVP